MEKGYTIKSTFESKDEDTIKKFLENKSEAPKIGGMGLEGMLKDLIHGLDQKSERLDNPFTVLNDKDFDVNDPIVLDFVQSFGPKKIVEIMALPKNESHEVLCNIQKRLQNIRLSNERHTLRYAYMALQNFIDKSNEAAKLERVAYKNTERSSGYWQIESIDALDKLYAFADTNNKLDFIKKARKCILSNDKKASISITKSLHSWYSHITPKENRRVAYTSLSTQYNEPYLMCPKGKYQGKGAVPMEISKCRENCIDSRLSKDGSVSCAYQDWLKVAFQSHDQVMSRLDVHRSDDNDQNLNLAEGERSKKLTELEKTFEQRFEESDRGANKVRGKDPVEKSRETQLSEIKAVQYGHQGDDKPVKHPKQAQSNSNKVVNDQISPMRKNQQGLDYLEALLRRLNNKESDVENARETQLDDAGLYSRKGEMESYPEQLENRKTEEVYVSEEINKNADDGSDESISQLLNKKIAKKSSDDKNSDEMLEERRTNKKNPKVNIESLLSDTDGEDWGHQYSDDDLKNFAKELGLDYNLESKREY